MFSHGMTDHNRIPCNLVKNAIDVYLLGVQSQLMDKSDYIKPDDLDE